MSDDLSAAVVVLAHDETPSAADLIVTNARVLTMDQSSPRAEAVAVRDGVIVAVGTAEAVGALQSPQTRLFDARGATVLPGFVEAHMHLFYGGVELAQLQLNEVQWFDALRAAILGFAAANPDVPMLLGQGASYTVLGEKRVTRHHLDAILPDRAFAMQAADHHTMWANTRALADAGILHGAELGPGNEIVMGEDGLATGELREVEAFGPIFALAGIERSALGVTTGGEPDPTLTATERAADRAVLRRGLDWCARHGITSIQNMDGNLYQLELLREIEAEGGLICRVQVPFHFKNFMDLGMLDKAVGMAESYQGEWLSSGMVKAFYDGVLDSWTAVMTEPYGDRPGWSGESLFTPEAFKNLAIAADSRGLQIAVHCVGDGAVRAVLDGYAAARRVNGARDSRHRIEHIEVVTAPDIPRFAELGVIASMQPLHAPGSVDFPPEPTRTRIGEDRWPLSYAWRTLKEAGAHVVFSSDWPVVPVDPIRSIQAALLRRPWRDGDPDQSLSLQEVLHAYTVEGAYAEFAEHRKGMIRTGYLADLVVLSGDIEATAPEALHELRPVTTICGGKVTYQVLISTQN